MYTPLDPLFFGIKSGPNKVKLKANVPAMRLKECMFAPELWLLVVNLLMPEYGSRLTKRSSRVL